MIVRECHQCQQKNRIPPRHLADRGKCGRCGAELPPIEAPLDVDATDFDAIAAEARVPVLVDFWAEWCGPCRMAAPEVKKAAKALAGRAIVLKVDTDRYGEVAARFGVQGIPNFVVLSDGKPVRQRAGLMDSRTLVEWASV